VQRRIVILVAVAVAAVAGLLTVREGAGPIPQGSPPQAAVIDGGAVFSLNCGRCHGEGAIGTDQGPPLVHRTYEPNHHADASFFLAVRKGVRSHHWPYGDMQPVAGITDDEIFATIAYVRALQREAGIF